MHPNNLSIRLVRSNVQTAASLQPFAHFATSQGNQCKRRVMDDLKQKYLGLIGQAADEAALEDLRVQALGKKGEISLQMRELGKMTPEER